jgi:hypothetical protein
MFGTAVFQVMSTAAVLSKSGGSKVSEQYTREQLDALGFGHDCKRRGDGDGAEEEEEEEEEEAEAEEEEEEAAAVAAAEAEAEVEAATEVRDGGSGSEGERRRDEGGLHTGEMHQAGARSTGGSPRKTRVEKEKRTAQKEKKMAQKEKRTMQKEEKTAQSPRGYRVETKPYQQQPLATLSQSLFAFVVAGTSNRPCFQ